MHVELRDEARNDIVKGALFYGRQSPGLDDYFVECIQKDLAKLQTTFGVHERVYGFYRRLSERFPFAIYYLVHETVVDVVAILDCRVDPDSTASRLT